MKSYVMIFDCKKGDFIEEYLYSLEPKKALIAAVMQLRGNFNTSEYPENIDGIYKSNVIKGRLLYDLDKNTTLYAQKA